MAAVSSGLSLIAQKFAKKPSMNMEQAFQRQATSLDVNALGKWVFGETDAPLDLVYEDQGGQRYVNQVIHVASHEIESFGEMHINDELAINSGGTVQSGWSGIVSRLVNFGTEQQTALNFSNSAWPNTADGEGLAHIGLTWDLTTGKEKISGGIPTRITQVIKGCKVYDPRLDSTVPGGSGSHRADDQTTWQYNDGSTDIGENWALLIAFYLLGWKNNGKLVIGVGVSPDDIDMEQLISAANVCEQIVDSKKRYKVGGVMVVDGDHQRVLKEFEAAIGGKVAKIGGKWFIWAPNDDLASSVDTLTDNDLIQDATQIFRPSGPIADRFNVARGRYIEPDLLYQPAYYPEVREDSAVLVDGRENVKEQDFSIIQDVSIAERVAREMVRRSRFTGTWQYVTWYTAIRFQPFDILTINTRDTNYEDVVVRVIDMAFSPDGIVQLTLIEEDSSIYDTSDPLGTPVTQFDPGAFDRTAKVPVTGLSVSQATISGSGGTATDALDVSWDDPGGIVWETEVQYRVSSTSDWQEVSARRVDFDNAIISPVEPGTNYDVRARHISITNVIGDWVTLTGQSTGSNSAAKQIANQGALATEDTADFATQVSGSEKPENNATRNTGDLADLDQVNTVHIIGNAVTNPALYASTATVTITNTFTYYEIASVNVPFGSAAPDGVLLVVTAKLNIGTATNIAIRLLYEGSQVVAFERNCFGLDTITISYLVESPSSGTRNFSAEVQRSSGVAFAVNNVALSVLGVKR